MPGIKMLNTKLNSLKQKLVYLTQCSSFSLFDKCMSIRPFQEAQAFFFANHFNF